MSWDGTFELFDDDPDWWRPDWQAEGEYARCYDLTPEGWAWEFIRRNKEYHEHWAWEESKCSEAYSVIHYEEIVGMPLDDGMDDSLPDLEPIYEELESGTLRLIRGINKASCATAWGFYLPYNPGIDEPSLTFQSDTTYPILDPGCVYDLPTFTTRLEEVESIIEPFGMWGGSDVQKLDWLAVGVVDLNQELPWQLQKLGEEAKKLQSEHLRDERPEGVGPRFGDLVTYLRILDGIEAEAERLDLARVLLPKIYGQVKDRPRRRAKFNEHEMRRQTEESLEREKALTAVRSLVRQARKMTRPPGYLRLVKTQLKSFSK